MDKNKITGYLNIAQKAGYIIWGGDNLENYTKKLYLVLYDPIVGKSTQKIVDKIKEKGIMVLPVNELNILLNKSICKIIGVKNKGISEILIDLLK